MIPAVPCRPHRHEIIGKVSKVGPKVKEFSAGQVVGVGAQVLSCGDCAQCKNHNEQYCQKKVFTYNAKYENGDLATGGYADSVRVNERFVFAIPDAIEPKYAAPLMCAGREYLASTPSFLAPE